MVSEEFLSLDLDLGLDMVNGVRNADVQGNDLARRRVDKNILPDGDVRLMTMTTTTMVTIIVS